MKLESMDITEVLKPLPERLMWHFSHLYMSHPAKILTEFKFYKGVEYGRTVVVCEYKDERYVGVAVKSAQDKMDESVGLTIALCRCLRSAGLLPKEHKQARPKSVKPERTLSGKTIRELYMRSNALARIQLAKAMRTDGRAHGKV